jgi:hypothetical protein
MSSLAVATLYWTKDGGLINKLCWKFAQKEESKFFGRIRFQKKSFRILKNFRFFLNQHFRLCLLISNPGGNVAKVSEGSYLKLCLHSRSCGTCVTIARGCNIKKRDKNF